MKYKLLLVYFFVVCLSVSAGVMAPGGTGLAKGNQPQVSVDEKGTLHIIFGRGDEIYNSASFDNGTSFSFPVLVAKVPGMHLGMSRGPQLASSKRYSVATAMDKSGNIHWFRLNNLSGKWQNMGLINDVAGSAPEGLMHIAADNDDHFYAVWLDIRTGKHNQIYFSALSPGADKWSENKLIYQSPDGHVCECCQPHIAVNGKEVAIMFRNWLNGSRDLYLTVSHNNGASFSPVEKLGANTWKLNGCPMDGGGLSIGHSAVATTWQRQGQIYYCQPGQPEKFIGNGRGSSVVYTRSKTFVAYQSQDSLKLVNVQENKVEMVGKGQFIKLAALPDKQLLCVWEDDDQIFFRKL